MSDKFETRCHGILRGVQFGWGTFTDKETGEVKRYPQLVGRFEILDGEDAGKYETWFGSLSDDVSSKGRSFYEYTIDALRKVGWKGDDMAELPAMAEAGDLATEVEFVREHRPDAHDATKWRSAVKYINRIGGSAQVDLKDNAMSADEIAAFAKKMKARIGGPRAAQPQGPRSAAPPRSSTRPTGGNGARPQSRGGGYDDRDVPPADPDDGIPF